MGIIFLTGIAEDAALAQTPNLTIRAGLPIIQIQQVIYGNGFYLLTSKYPTTFYRSTDGINWLRETGASVDSISRSISIKIHPWRMAMASLYWGLTAVNCILQRTASTGLHISPARRRILKPWNISTASFVR
jgi:hypothetical protein